MKRCICVLLALLLSAAVPALAEAAVDIDELTLDELYDLRAQIDARIQAIEAERGEIVYESGSYIVGTDIPAGDYVLIENADAVFATAIIRAGDSEDADLVAYHLVNGQAVIRLSAETWLTLSEAKAYPLAQVGQADAESYGEGGWLVGPLLPPGDYVVTPSEKAPLSSYSIYDGILGTGAQLEKFEVLRDAMTLRLEDGKYVELSGCTLSPAK